MGIIFPQLVSYLFATFSIKGFAADTTRTPYGSRMCQHLCNTTGGYSSCVFSTSNLSCHMFRRNEMITLKNGDVVFDVTKSSIHCPDVSKLLQIRGHRIKWICISNRRRHKLIAMDVRRRLLIARVQKNQKRAVIHQFFFVNGSIYKYPFIAQAVVSAIAYMSRLQEVLVSRKFPNVIFSYHLDSYKRNRLSKKAASSIAVDDKMELIFFTNFPKGIVEMNPDGSEPIYISKKKKYYGIAVDPKGQRMYVTSSSDLLLFTYSGKFKGSVAKGHIKFALSFDSVTDVLYYCKNKVLCKGERSGQNYNVTLTFAIRNLVTHAESIYASSKDNRMTRINANKLTVTEIYDVGRNYRNNLKMCTVP